MVRFCTFLKFNVNAKHSSFSRLCSAESTAAMLVSALIAIPTAFAATSAVELATLNKQKSSPAVADFANCAKPEWPKAALRSELTGIVTLGFLIGADGSVLDAVIRESSGSDLLDDAARDGVRRCTFRPAFDGGKPTEAWMQMQYV